MTRTNRLAQEKSPYLLQHARNPVDWHPWGQEAIDKARREDKPLFLSIGYSTCHWCHVMERESFEDEQIAEKLNRAFVPVKVDREERPDVDKIYMTAVQALTGQGGWPLSVFLTPALKPFFGGTYFPPQPRFGMPGFPALLDRVAELWKTQREAIENDAGKLTQALSDFTAVKGAAHAPQAEWIAKAARGYLASFDPENAGFGGAPKFPMPVNQGFLLRAWAMTGEEEPRKAAAATLRAMARGGIRDHLGGGFHRYSTDERWRVPHFEKMLYDNAQLAVNYLEMCQAEWDEEFAAAARAALDYLLRDLRGPEGEIYSAEDADSLANGEKKEGAFYLWTEAELKAELADDAPIFLFTYGILPEGNSIHDPHGELSGQNVLYEAHTLPEVCEQFGLSAEQAASRLAKAHRRLLEARAKRPRPSRDDKVLACWNGLAISAFAKGWQVLEDARYLEAARKAASFIKDRLWDRGERKLWRRWCDGERAVPGTADDYAFMISGLLDLFEADFDPAWLDWALELSRRLRESFEDAGGGYYLTAQGEDPNLLLRVMDDTDNVEPCASSVAALSFLRIAELTGDEAWRKAAEKTLARFGSQMRDRPQAMPAMLSAAVFALSQPQQVVLAGDLSSAEGKRMLSEVRTRFSPARTVAAVEKDGERLGKIMPWLKDMKAQGGKPTAFVCAHFACQKPVTDAQALAEQLDACP